MKTDVWPLIKTDFVLTSQHVILNRQRHIFVLPAENSATGIVSRALIGKNRIV